MFVGDGARSTGRFSSRDNQVVSSDAMKIVLYWLPQMGSRLRDCAVSTFGPAGQLQSSSQKVSAPAQGLKQLSSSP